MMTGLLLSLANSALQIANIKEVVGKYKDALSYARRATDLYLSIYGMTNEIYIASLWLTICIAYSLESNEVFLHLFS